MEPYIEFIGTLQNSGFWLVKVFSLAGSGVPDIPILRMPEVLVQGHVYRPALRVPKGEAAPDLISYQRPKPSFW